MNRLSATCLAVMFGCAVGLVVLSAVLWRAGATQRTNRRAAPQRGAVMLEFVLIVPVALWLVMVMAQSTLVLGGNLCVHYAAYCGARSAIVQAPLERGDEWPNYFDSSFDPEASPKLEQIRQAAVWAVMGVSRSNYERQNPSGSYLAEAIGGFLTASGKARPGWVDRYLASKFSYANDMTEVELAAPVDGLTYGRHEDLRVIVRHHLYLAVPLASRLFANLADGVVLDDGAYALIVEADCTLPNEGPQDYIDVEHFD